MRKDEEKEDYKDAMYEANMQGDEQPWCWVCEEYVVNGRCKCTK